MIVIGPESSGNRLIFETLRRAGGFIADDEKIASWWEDPKKIEYDADRITMRSLPHFGIGNGRKFFDPIGLALHARSEGYDVRFVVTTRDRTIAARSKTREHTKGDTVLAESEMSQAREVLAGLISAFGERCFLWNYETFMFLREDYLKALYRWLGVSNEKFPEFIDGNVKYLAQ